MAEKAKHKRENKLQLLHSSLGFRGKKSSCILIVVMVFYSQKMCMLLKETKTNILEISVKMLYFDLLRVAIPTILMLFPETYKPRSRCLEKHQFVTVSTREHHGNNYVTRKYSFS